MKTGAPRRARRRVERQRQEGAFGLPQRQPARQCQPQPGFSLVPELDEIGGADTPPSMDQTSRPVRCGVRHGGKPQGAQGAGRRGGGCAAPNAPWVAAWRFADCKKQP